MATTKQDRAIAAANALMNLCGTLRGAKQAIDDFVTNYNKEGWSAAWAALATAAQNADGSLGAADGTPNTAHPIDTRVGSQAALAKAVTQAQLVSGVVAVQAFQNMVNAAAVTTGDYAQSIHDLAS